MIPNEWRTERDALGDVRIPSGALWGAQTQRAVENFRISGRGFPRAFILALAEIKRHASEANAELAVLERDVADAIQAAAREVIDGAHENQFPVDVYQTGSGTSTNMNMNEVLARRATQLLHEREESARAVHPNDRKVHPNDHVNAGQSSNDVIPTAMHLSALAGIDGMLLPAMETLHAALQEKAEAFADIVKVGRTHLMDAAPLTMGQEFSGYAAQVGKGLHRIHQAREALLELPLGGTAVGTGLNAHPEFAGRVIALLAKQTGLPLREAENHFEAQAARDAAVEASAALKTVSVSLMKIANDIRWMSSGPRAGLGEIHLPALQPGSSIMPGKVNPVLPEALAMVCARVMGNDVTVTIAGQSGNFELNVMIPLIAVTLLESIELLANAVHAFATRCIAGIEPRHEQLRQQTDRNLMIITALVPAIGHEAAAAIAQEAERSGRGIRDVALERSGLTEEELDRLLGISPRATR
ncbi:MAG: class II fumarate hydratase [Bacteroidetes bacterium]|nr:class II fumarate hydratase [Bacteroidota bacterium]